MDEIIFNDLHATLIYQPHIVQTWFVIATIVSGAKYAIKIIPSTSATNKYRSAIDGILFFVMLNILGGHSAMNRAFFNGQID